MILLNSELQMLLYSILSTKGDKERFAMAQRIRSFYQNGSSGDGAFDTAVRRAFNKQVENVDSVIKNPSLLIGG